MIFKQPNFEKKVCRVRIGLECLKIVFFLVRGKFQNCGLKEEIKLPTKKRGLFNNVDLLTLSACDTAMSANGKESESFAWLAQSLGAKTVPASLWKVSDAGTPELMLRFYKIRAENPNIPKAEAFRQAQISLLGAEVKTKTINVPRSGVFKRNSKNYELRLWEKDKHPQFAHPHFWGSFVLIGNWR